MGEVVYTVEEVAERLKLHPRTVRRYLREKRLKGSRIGKEWRVAAADLEAFAPAFAAGEREVSRRRHVEVSAIVQIDAIAPDAASRVTNGVLGAAKGRPEGDAPLQVHSQYDEARGKLKIFVSGSPETTVSLLGLISFYLEGA